MRGAAASAASPARAASAFRRRQFIFADARYAIFRC